ncbi:MULTISPECIES: efflux RND transporter periplasmic adaptor subunit [unclassified Lysobacter]|uniref:efflux RND transporter periplasmic adaptor subunit n=1 Tax=unclassified Lysobacter TaxID=2635362 RepID=UPI001BE7B37B|nr:MULTISPECIES: efflux RND transporter periplasmic adaptor subunit [unclassified Lysobacter]MBT2746656.1 efflux RND transporter periplasmic adaptor subunit [Lysobacter sp. ISL-42]MBT2751705.1 efflux RND transporter periplasmic adaptor subunit [Lysobacter sp. ISL-50]MBT2778057.1 efflux RND transporter periplasmic adaptor subunit [Lysobacter sp. ISL-54]MBT2781698.1 efflux RND transporter periplasmic adaptor subunit [Lysobacter sp. ISL-52]
MRQLTNNRNSGPAVRGTVALAALALACTLGLSACKGGAGAAEAQAKEAKDKVSDAVPVEVAQASRRAIAASYTGTAPLEARAESQVVAKTSGVALDVMVEEGQLVKAGQVLVRLDSARAEQQAAQTAATMRKLEANYARARQMADQRLLSANDADQLRYDLDSARAANRLATLELSYAKVEAPISGVVASRSIKTGNFVQINSPIIRIVDTSQLEATLNVPERELATLKAGLPVQMLVDAMPGKPFTGTVARVAPVVDSGSGTFRVICSFEGGGVLQPGMFGRLRIDYDNRADALVVPRAALLDDEGDPAVFVVRGKKVSRVPVKLGYMDGAWAEIRSGVKLGEQVVVAGKTALREGTEVLLINTKPATVAAADKPAAGKPASDKQ